MRFRIFAPFLWRGCLDTEPVIIERRKFDLHMGVGSRKLLKILVKMRATAMHFNILNDAPK